MDTTFKSAFGIKLPQKYTPLNVIPSEHLESYALLTQKLTRKRKKLFCPSLYKRYCLFKKRIQREGDAFIRDRFEIKKHPKYPEIGVGLFAKTRFKKGEILGLYTGEVNELKPPLTLRVSDLDYAFILIPGSPWLVNSKKMANYTAFANDPGHTALLNLFSTNTIDPEGHPDTIYFANRAIQPGEEIFASYGPGYWNSRRILPYLLL